MKFGKQILSKQINEWSSHYLDYKGLKKIINSLQNAPAGQGPPSVTVAASPPPGVIPEDERSKFLQSQKAAFFFKLERELEKINSFYLQKENELKVRLRSLEDKKRILQAQGRRLSHESASLHSLKEGFQQLEHDLDKLQKFVELNGTGFRKILKKWDKRSKSSTKELYLSRQIDIQPCFNPQVLTKFADMAAANLLELDDIASGSNTLVSSVPTTPMEPRRFDFEESNVINDAEVELYKAMMTGQSSTVHEILERISGHPALEDRERISKVFWRACSEATEDIIQLLVDTGMVDFKYVDDINDRSCLHEAAIRGELWLVKLCVENGVDVLVTDVYGRKPLHYTCMYGFHECATYLLSQGSSPDKQLHAVDHDGFTPLIFAITNASGFPLTVKILLEHGANIEPIGEGGHNPLSLACQYGQKDIATMLLDRGANIQPNSETPFPLHLAAREGHADICKLLTERGAGLDTPDKNNDSWTPIFYAASEGHIDCVKVLIEANCQVNIKDDADCTPLYYAAWEGEVECVDLLIAAGCKAVFDEQADETMEDVDFDLIPVLSLPPPIIPFRIYGHNYLDKKYQIQVQLGRPPIVLYGNTQSSSLKLVMSSKPDHGTYPHSIILPLVDESEIFSFQADSLEKLSLEFDIFPTFGSKVIGKGVHFANVQSRQGAGVKITTPLFDSHLKIVGEILFELTVIKPFSGVQLEIGGRVATYWKSTNISSENSQAGQSGGNVPSFITASSLSGSYLRIIVQVTRDFVPVVFPDWLLPVDGFDLCVSDVTYEQFKSFAEKTLNKKAPDLSNNKLNDAELANLINGSYMSLQEVFKALPTHVGVDIEIKYPNRVDFVQHRFSNIADINNYVDMILQCIYDEAKTIGFSSSMTDSAHRPLMFSSFSPAVCTAVNWKQPNYAVFFNTFGGFTKESFNRGKKRKEPGEDGCSSIVYTEDNVEEDKRCISLKEAVKFSRRNNLLGVICEATPLVQVPSLIKHVKESGLLLITFGDPNRDPRCVGMQEKYGVDAQIVEDVVKFNNPESL